MGLFRPHDRHGTADGGTVGTQFLLPRHCGQVQLGCTQIRNPARQREQCEDFSKIETRLQREICMESGSASGCTTLVRNDGGGATAETPEILPCRLPPSSSRPNEVRTGIGDPRDWIVTGYLSNASEPGPECSRPEGRVTDHKKGPLTRPFLMLV